MRVYAVLLLSALFAAGCSGGGAAENSGGGSAENGEDRAAQERSSADTCVEERIADARVMNDRYRNDTPSAKTFAKFRIKDELIQGMRECMIRHEDTTMTEAELATAIEAVDGW